MGLVSQVFDESALASLRGHIAVGHTPVLHDRRLDVGERAADPRRGRGDVSCLGAQRKPHQHHGAARPGRDQLGSRRAARRARPGQHLRHGARDDAARGRPRPPHRDGGARGAAAAAGRLLLRLHGREHPVRGARRPRGAPLALGRLERGWVVASETAALRHVGASVVREIEPGELVAIDEHGLRSHRFAPAQPKGCVFEYVYLARPDAIIRGRVVHEARVEMGRQLAREHPVDADLVIGVPESGCPRRWGTRRRPASRTARGSSRTPTWAGPSSSRPRRCASWASGSSSTPWSTRSAASGWWSSTTRSCAATPSAPRSGCCGRRAP